MNFFKSPNFASLLFFSLLTQSAHADWNQASIEWGQEFNQRNRIACSSEIATSWGSLHTRGRRTSGVRTVRIPNEHFEKGFYKAAMIVQESSELETAEAAPLMIALPGMFGNFRNRGARRLLQAFASRGYHVVVPSNPWSRRFIRDQPDFHTGDILAEANFVRDLIAFAIDEIGEENISSISLAGESYGSLQAAIAYTQDQLSDHPVISGTVTLFSPPQDLKQGEVILDAGIERTQDKLYDHCHKIGTLFALFKGFRSLFASTESPPLIEECAAPLVYGNFQSNLVKSAKKIDRLYGLDIIPSTRSERKQWKRELRFANMTEGFFPDLVNSLDDGRGSLLHWLHQLPPESLKRLRIMTANDDFLNQDLPWPLNDAAVSEKILIKLQWGGHMGYESLEEFKELLDLAF